MPEIKFEIVEHIGVLAESTSGWKKELNKVSWNERDAKYDIREWSPDHDRMRKGITLNEEEMEILKQILDEMYI